MHSAVPVSTDHSNLSPKQALFDRVHKILSYYIKCLQRESGDGVRTNWAERGRRWIPVAFDWSTSRRREIELDSATLPLDWTTGSRLVYGYPLIVMESAKTPLNLLPLFLQPVEVRSKGSRTTVNLDTSEPCYLNREVLLALAQEPERQRALRKALSDSELGSVESSDLETLLASLCDFEVIEPSSLDLHATDIESTKPGLYHHSGIYRLSQTQYTTGLQQELAALQANVSAFEETALAALLDVPGAPINRDESFIQALPLDRQQRATCEQAWRNRLTVVTGPPGTGKTQIIVGLLIDALLRDRRVLFASKNQRAVANVESRFDTLVGPHALIRAGHRAGAEDLRQAFLSLLTDLLSAPSQQPTVSIHTLRRDYRTACRRRGRLVERLQAIANGAKPPNATLLSRALAMTENAVVSAGLHLLTEMVSRRNAQLPGRSRQILNRYRASLERLLGNRDRKVSAQLRQNLASQFKDLSSVFPLWSVTNLSASSSLPLNAGMFDLVIIDEASQSDIASALPLLYRAKRALIIGDNQQLRHIADLPSDVEHHLMHRYQLFGGNEALGYVDNSLFDLALAAPGAEVARLNNNYRSHAELIGFSNAQWYRDALVPMACYKHFTSDSERPPWQWVDTQSRSIRSAAGGVTVPVEQQAVRHILQALYDDGFSGSVGIVTPFREQSAALTRQAHRFPAAWRDARQLKVSTAHGFQGDERDLMIVSLCLAKDLHEGARTFLIRTDNLLNVAVTRARAHTILIGDRQACLVSNIGHYQKLAEFFDEQSTAPTGECYQQGPTKRYSLAPFVVSD